MILAWRISDLLVDLTRNFTDPIFEVSLLGCTSRGKLTYFREEISLDVVVTRPFLLFRLSQ